MYFQTEKGINYIALSHIFRNKIYLPKNSDKLYNTNTKIGGGGSREIYL